MTDSMAENADYRPEEIDAGASSAAGSVSRVTLRLSPKARAAIDEIMALGGMDTIQEAIRRAVSDELFFMKERKQGWKVLLQRNGKYREVNWSDLIPG